MEAIPEPSRTRIKREYSDDPEYSENNSDSDKRKKRSGKSRKHINNYSESNSQESKEDYDGIKKESSSSHRSSRSSKRSSEERERRRDEERETERREKSTPRSHVKEERYLEEDNLVIDNKSESRERERGNRERKDPRERESQTPDDANHRVYSDSDHEKNEREIEEYNDENKSYKFKERNREYNEREGSRDYWRNNNNNNNREFNSRGGYRKDLRGRSETGKSNPGFGNRNFENSDSIEIRPVRNLDFTRDSDFENNDDQRDRYNNRGGSMNPNPNQSGPNKNINNNSNNNNNNLNSPLSNQFGGRGIRGGFGRGRLNNNNNNNNNNNINNNNPQRNIGVQNLQMPMMGPPFGPMGLPPGPLGPNMGPPPLFIPPFPPIWPGGRGMDINLIPNLPPNLPPIPPIQVPPRFNPNLTPIQIPQVSSSNKNMATPSREMTPLDKPNNSIVVSNNNNNNMSNNAAWLANRNMPGGKAPSRGEQNDYSQNFVDTGMRPQNFIRELELSSVVEDYPKLRELIQRKDEIVANAASAPMYYSCDLKEHVLSPEFFGTKFDVILVDPPWEEYVHRAPGITDHIEYWTMEEIMNLKLEAIADTPSFIFLWVGDGVGLEQGRQCLKKWGFRRCEDICWVKTNKKSAGPGLRHDSHTLFQHSKEHCLMGIKGTVRRSTDGHIIHANIDTDIIIAEEPSDGSTKKPEDMYRIIEHFALGKRRLELFGEDHNIRPGWLTVGKGLSSSNFNKEAYIRNFADKDGKVWLGGGGRNPPPEAPHLVVTTPEIESLRPKSPPQKGQNQNPLPPVVGGGNNSISRRNSVNSNQDLISIIGNGNNGGGGGNGMFELGDGSGSNSGMFIDAFGFPNLL